MDSRINHWLPKMKSCLDATSYERLPEITIETVGNEIGNDTRLLFHNDDGSEQAVYIEPHLLTRHLLSTLATKNRVPKNMNHCVIEYLDKMGIERIIEDHEYVYSSLQTNEHIPDGTKRVFYFRREPRKYDFFESPNDYFPHNVLDQECRSEIQSRGITSIILEARSPTIVSWGWVFDAKASVWKQAYFVLKDKKVYVTLNRSLASKFHARNVADQETTNETRISDLENCLQVFARLSDYFIYSAVNARNHFRAPTEWGVVLRPTGQQDTEPDLAPGLRCFAFNSERLRNSWLTGMRIAKYGKSLRDNYLHFRNKTSEDDLSKYTTSASSHAGHSSEDTSIESPRNEISSIDMESHQSRVPMDFSGGKGLIVSDKEEARAIEVGEGSSWNRQWRKSIWPGFFTDSNEYVEISKVHENKPWYHADISRDKASRLVSKYGTMDGVFLVRESHSSDNAFVLTYIFKGKVIHAQIKIMRDPIQNLAVFTLDGGRTKFYDLLQLIEFYELNEGTLNTRLTHYILQKAEYAKSESTAY